METGAARGRRHRGPSKLDKSGKANSTHPQRLTSPCAMGRYYFQVKTGNKLQSTLLNIQVNFVISHLLIITV